MKAHDRKILHSSDESDHRTPPELFAPLDAEFDFTLDVAATGDSSLAPNYYGPDHSISDYRNALLGDWSRRARLTTRRGVSWMNNPYSVRLAQAYTTGRIRDAKGNWRKHPVDPVLAATYKIENWVQKAWEESQTHIVVGLLPASEQTEWWLRWIWQGMGAGGMVHRATEIRKIPHRVSFLSPDGCKQGNAAVNHAIVIWKPPCGYIEPWQPTVRYWEYRA